jgi:hypothetical protein
MHESLVLKCATGFLILLNDSIDPREGRHEDFSSFPLRMSVQPNTTDRGNVYALTW